jgi:hypothetical protein
MTYTIDLIPSEINQHFVLPIPTEISREFPSRGLVMIKGKLDGVALTAPLEPNGQGSHFLLLSDDLVKGNIKPDQSVKFEFSITQEWIEPDIPRDIKDQITEAQLIEVWTGLTVKARWEWLRWIRSTRNPVTRNRRITVAVAKLQQGERRPCCFNSASCTLPEISKSGVLDLP